ncbi:hypothetical protein Tco_1217324 [Tanacetum coccineum]
MAALYILDKLSDVSGSSLFEDKMKVVFSQAWECDEGFIEALDELSFAFRVSLTKDRRFIAKLEALGQRGDALKPLEYMREMVARDSARVKVLEQLLVDAHVGMRLKAGYADEMLTLKDDARKRHINFVGLQVMFHAEREAKSIVLNKNNIKVVPPVFVSY